MLKSSYFSLLMVIFLLTTFPSVINMVLCWPEKTDSFGIRLRDKWFIMDQKFSGTWANDYVQEMLLPIPPSGYTVSSIHLEISFFKRIDLLLDAYYYPAKFYYKAVVNYIRIKEVKLIIIGDDTPPYGEGNFKAFTFTLWSNIYGYGSKVVEGIVSDMVKETVVFTYPRKFVKNIDFGKRIYVLESKLKVVWTASFSLYIRWLDTEEAGLNGGLIATVHTAVINVNYVKGTLHESYLEVCSWPISVPMNGSGYSVFFNRFTNFTIVKKGQYTAFSEILYAPRYYNGFIFAYWIVGGNTIKNDSSLRLNIGDNRRIKVIAVYYKVSQKELVVIPGAHIPISLNLSDIQVSLNSIRIRLSSSIKWIKLHFGNSFMNSCHFSFIPNNVIVLPNYNIGVMALLYDPTNGTALHDYWRRIIGHSVYLNITVLHDKDFTPIGMFSITAIVDDIEFQVDCIKYNESGVEIIVTPYLAHSGVRFIDLREQSSWYLKHLALALTRRSARYTPRTIWPFDDKGTIHIFLTYGALRDYVLNTLSNSLSYINFTMIELHGNSTLPVGLSDLSLKIVKGSLIVDRICSTNNSLLILCRMVAMPYNTSLYGFHVKVLDSCGNTLGLWDDSDMDGSIAICLRDVSEVVLIAYPPDEFTADYIILPSVSTVIKVGHRSRG